jgi:hypothetical protein
MGLLEDGTLRSMEAANEPAAQRAAGAVQWTIVGGKV